MTFLLAAFLAVPILHKMNIYHSSVLQATEITSGYLAGSMSTYAWLRIPLPNRCPEATLLVRPTSATSPWGVTPQLPR